MILPAADPLVAWRRIALDKQLPAPRFPSGIRAPSVALLCALLVLAVVCAVYLGMFHGRVIPQAVVDSQNRLVTGLARGLNATVTTGVEEMEAAAGQVPPGGDPAAVLATAGGGGTAWAGAAVLDATSRQPVAARGEPVPVANVPQDVPRTTVTPLIQGAEPRALIVAPLPDGRLLAGMTSLRVRPLRLAPNSSQSVLVGLSSGESTVVQGTPPAGGEAGDVIKQALAEAREGRAVRSTGGPPGSALLVVAAPVGSLGIAVASTVAAPVVELGSPWKGLAPAAGLVVAALLAYLVARRALVRPVRRLLLRAKADACGDPEPRPRIKGPAEVRRIAAALDDRARPRGVPAVMLLLGVPAIVLGWSGALGYAFAGGPVPVPAQVVLDSENQVTAATVALGEALDGGLREATIAAAQGAQTAPAQLTPALDRLVSGDDRYRGAYVTDPEGQVVTAAGRDPLREAEKLPRESGVRLANTGGRLPVIYAYAHRPDGHSVVVEFDVPQLADLLRRADGRVRVVDSELRTILDTEGFLAFQPLAGGEAREAATAALQGRTAARVAGRALVAGTPLAEPGSAAGLRWSVVAEQAVGDLALPANGLRRASLVLGGAAAFLAVAALGWHYFVLLLPLRRVAAAADRLADGDTETVISPHRPDEIGAIASCLEICRQARVHGPTRLGGAERLRGTGAPPTVVVRRPPNRRQAGARRAGRR
ncbi:HAMP domain-containing protein [Phytohabitans suffuscus]|uniref:HAMP domain-containing protein n=1 Tax=Phytohabitans suffuscus TaxID=624315 RepID=UPI001563CDCE|nr:HAMP domain-containing protein [Phytohabitans suffuscus]